VWKVLYPRHQRLHSAKASLESAQKANISKNGGGVVREQLLFVYVAK
jgi:hypothetical protein